MARLTRLLTNVAVLIGGVFMIGASLVIFVEVLIRKFANMSLEGLHEVSGFAMAVTFAWAMPFTILTRGHIRVDVLYGRLSRRWRLGLDIFAALAFSFYLIALAIHAYTLTAASWSAGTIASGILGIPLYIPQALWALGLIIACLVLIIALGVAVRALLLGQIDAAAKSLAPYGESEDKAVMDDLEAGAFTQSTTSRNE
jgi:TRAP-type C4-dicarboxylate transport system permease small subunit